MINTCKTSNWVLHVSTLAPGAQTWIDSGALLEPDATSHLVQMAEDADGNLGAIGLQGGNLVSLVRRARSWSSPARRGAPNRDQLLHLDRPR